MLCSTDLIEKIKDIKKKFKECKESSTDEVLKKLKKDMEIYGVNHPEIPYELELLWKISSEWHLIEDHYNVFGFNIYNPKNVLKTNDEIFGNEESKKEWLKYVGEDSCGNNDWICIVGYTEYDYIFVNLNKKSCSFGATRHMVNNCTIDEKLTDPPFSNFIEYIDKYIKNDYR